MKKILFSKKCEILGRLWFLYRDDARENSTWSEYFATMDLGLPLAFLVHSEMANATRDGKVAVEEAWVEFCDILSLDPLVDYESLEAAFDARDDIE